MAVASQILKNFNLFLDGRGYAGNVDELKTPTLALAGEDFRGGGMDTSTFIELGQEKLEASFTLSGYQVETLKLWGVGPGLSVPLTARGALEGKDGVVTPVVVWMTGTLRSIETPSWKAGERNGLPYAMELDYYKYEQDGVTIYEIDVLNMVRIVNGVDRLAAQRAALGM